MNDEPDDFITFIEVSSPAHVATVLNQSGILTKSDLLTGMKLDADLWLDYVMMSLGAHHFSDIY